jgi:elongation factor G
MNGNALKSAVIGGINARRRTIIDSEIREDEFTAIAGVALTDMFGLSRLLRGATQGKGEFSTRYRVLSTPLPVEYRRGALTLAVENHTPVLQNVQAELQEEYRSYGRKSLLHDNKK